MIRFIAWLHEKPSQPYRKVIVYAEDEIGAHEHLARIYPNTTWILTQDRYGESL